MNKTNYFKTAFLFCALLASNISFSQNSDKKKCKVGVYRTADDFRNNRMIEGKKVGFGLYFASGDIAYFLKLKIGGSTHTTLKYHRGSAFAYRDKDCSLYRFYKEDDFAKVLNTDGIYLYSITNTGKYHYISYYFSKDMYAPLVRLTKKNLINEYGGLPSFAEKIGSLKNDAQLIKRDKSNGNYKVVNLINDSVK